jgi:type VI secretion system protein ImpJ
MKLLSRVVWSEGMYLAPHHFQTQNRYFEDAIHFAASALWFKPYGLLETEMDAEALQNGTVAVHAARGVFADGLPFNIPGSDPAPEPRSIAELFSPTRDSHVVHLAIPQRRPDGRNFSDPAARNGDELRYVAETQVLPDEMSGRDEKPVQLGRKNFSLLLDTELSEQFSTLPLARIRRDGAGRFIYDPAFIPPVLRIAGSEALMNSLRRLCEILDEKTRTMTSGAAAAGEALADRYRRDLSSFWYLHTINSSLGALRHQLLAKKGHPEELYVDLLRLAGGLSCFALDTHPKDLPLYNHDDLSGCFDALLARIRAWLDLIIPDRCVTIALQSAAPSYWSAQVNDVRCLDKARWIFEIESRAGEAAVITQTPVLAKICSQRFIERLVRHALPGLTLTHLPVPPPEVPARVEAQYFSITRNGPCWQDIVSTHTLGVYIPDNLPEPQLAIHILLER